MARDGRWVSRPVGRLVRGSLCFFLGLGLCCCFGLDKVCSSSPFCCFCLFFFFLGGGAAAHADREGGLLLVARAFAPRSGIFLAAAAEGSNKSNAPAPLRSDGIFFAFSLFFELPGERREERSKCRCRCQFQPLCRRCHCRHRRGQPLVSRLPLHALFSRHGQRQQLLHNGDGRRLQRRRKRRVKERRRGRGERQKDRNGAARGGEPPVAAGEAAEGAV